MTTLALGERTGWIDCDVIQADGGTRTASLPARSSRSPWPSANRANATCWHSLTDYVAAISVGIVDGERCSTPPTKATRAEVDMNIVKTGDGRFIEVQGTAESIPFGRGGLDQLLDLADTGIKQLIEKQRAIVGHLVK